MVWELERSSSMSAGSFIFAHHDRKKKVLSLIVRAG
jgi:hypothetical protein